MKGECKSHCAEHSWIEKPRWAGKGSIFEEQEDEAAYEEEEEEDTDNIEKNSNVAFIGQGNNFGIVREFLESEGWVIEEPAFKSSNRFLLN